MPEAAPGCLPPGFTLDRAGSLHDFDFVAGEWSVRNRILRIRGAGCTEWATEAATHSGKLFLGGVANVDEMVFPEPRGRGMAVRTFDVARRQWSIRWVSSRDGIMGPPVVGGFSGARGEFYGIDVCADRPVKVRFVWTRQDDDHARWEQSFSYDDATWETNWIMDFERRAPAGA
ncbi:MAG TPA: hypothetical protein VM146_04915 [Steroidobacteraceae bacterium]|nr:hypothetical protein [Steroidobacteraceae bacterium]